mmetsp:Transcript_9758/g.14035  ORF Transcript_9758/g.14035 Transcript_9758/m.14035 type:complete len:117 (+) Transcript_9758:83-433(+)
MISVEEIFATMGEALPGTKGKFPSKTVVMKIDGSSFYKIDGSKSTVQPCEEGTQADLTVNTSLETLQKLLEKKLTPQQAFMKGLLKIKGNMGLAMKLNVIVNATRKQLSKSPKAKL